jgi:ferredoxin
MRQLSVDANTCTGCGLCETECGINHVISVHDGKARYNNSGTCIECLHCFKICPNRAINYHSEVQASLFGSDEHASAVVTRRSCRDFKQASLDRESLTHVINVANAAPRFDVSFDERQFIVLDDQEKLNGVRSVVLSQIDKVRKLFSILVKNPFLPKGRKTEYGTIIDLFDNILEKSKKSDALFHGAPTLVMVAGQKTKSSTKDNSLYAMSQFLIAAEEQEIGTCISGFVSFFSKAVQKYLGIDNSYSIHCAAVAGYPAKRFTRHLVRNDTSIRWN